MTGPIERAKDGHRLADVARRTGIAVPAEHGTCTVRCPMPAHGHPDRSPSLRLYLDDNRYFCFGCGVRGDVVQWVRDAEEATIADAVRLLDSGEQIRNAWGASTIQRYRRRPPGGAGETEIPDLTRTPLERVLQAVDEAASWAQAPSGAALPRPAATWHAGRRGGRGRSLIPRSPREGRSPGDGASPPGNEG